MRLICNQQGKYCWNVETCTPWSFCSFCPNCGGKIVLFVKKIVYILQHLSAHKRRRKCENKKITKCLLFAAVFQNRSQILHHASSRVNLTAFGFHTNMVHNFCCSTNHNLFLQNKGFMWNIAFFVLGTTACLSSGGDEKARDVRLLSDTQVPSNSRSRARILYGFPESNYQLVILVNRTLINELVSSDVSWAFWTNHCW